MSRVKDVKSAGCQKCKKKSCAVHGRNNFCPKLSVFAPKCVFYSPLIVCICPKSSVSYPKY